LWNSAKLASTATRHWNRLSHRRSPPAPRWTPNESSTAAGRRANGVIKRSSSASAVVHHRGPLPSAAMGDRGRELHLGSSVTFCTNGLQQQQQPPQQGPSALLSAAAAAAAGQSGCRPTAVVLSADCSDPASTDPRLQRSRSVTSHYPVATGGYRRSVSPSVVQRSARLVAIARSDPDPETGTCRRLTLMPPPPTITYGPSTPSTEEPLLPQQPQPQQQTQVSNTPTGWSLVQVRAACESLVVETEEGTVTGGTGGTSGYKLQATPCKSVTLTPRGSFLAINQPPLEFCESMLNISCPSEGTGPGNNGFVLFYSYVQS